MLKVSVLYTAYNEEKMVVRSLSNLVAAKRIYPNMEVLAMVGGDDRTYELCIPFKKLGFKIFEEKRRAGKTAALNELLSKAKGNIILIHDADWLLKNIEKLGRMMHLFEEDPALGGVLFSEVPLEHIKDRKTSPLMSGEFWLCKLQGEYFKKFYTEQEGEKLYVDRNKVLYPFGISVFRREIVKQIPVIADDFYFSMEALRKGYKIMLLDATWPHFEILYRSQRTKDSYKLKLRGQIAMKQLNKMYTLHPWKHYPKFGAYILANLYRVPPKALFGLVLWSLMFALAVVRGAFSRMSTFDAWKLRAKR